MTIPRAWVSRKSRQQQVRHRYAQIRALDAIGYQGNGGCLNRAAVGQYGMEAPALLTAPRAPEDGGQHSATSANDRFLMITDLYIV
jgi:hypothetical protein